MDPITIPFEWPTEWAEWIQALDSWLGSTQLPVPVSTLGMNDLDALVSYAVDNGFAVIRDETGAIIEFVQMNVIDPASSPEAIPVPIADIEESLEVAGAVASYTFAGGASGLVDRAAAVGAVLSLMTATIAGMQVIEEVREQLIESVTPYTKDGEHVAVYYGKHNGQWKTYLPEDVITAVRDKAVELGIFSAGLTPDYTQVVSSTITPTKTSVTNALKLIYMTIAESCLNGHPYDTNQALSAQEQYNFFMWLSENVFNDSVYSALGGTKLNWDGYASNITAIKKSSSSVIFLTKNSYDVTSSGSCFLNNSEFYQVSFAQNISPLMIENAATTENDGFTITSEAPSGMGYNTQPVVNFKYSNGSRYIRIRIPAQTITVNDVQYTRTSGTITSTYYQNGSFGQTIYTPYAFINSSLSSSLRGLILLHEDVASVDGITPTSSLPADAAKTLADLLPDAWSNKVSLAAPTNSNIFNKKNYLPTSIETENPFADGTTQTTSEAQTGDIEDPLKTPLIDYVNELITQMINDPDNPIPTDFTPTDSGDTPPENPPLLDGASNGLWTIYNPTLAEVQAFGAWLWSSSILDQITRMFNSPIDAVIGFHQIYCTPITGASKHIMAGFLDSNVSAAEVTNQYAEIDCGTVSVDEYYGNVLDYMNTRISIFLPFCGFFPLDTAVVMGSTLEVTYRIDVLTGTCLAQVKVIKENSDAVMYSFAGNCAVQIPLTATTYTGMVGALVSTLSAGASLMTGNVLGAGASAMRAMTAGVSGLSGVRQSGSMGANSGALGIRIPYLIVTHPAQANAADFNEIGGFPANKTVRLGDVSGFTRVYAAHLDAISGATADEIEQIREMLSNGVIL